MHCMHDLIDAHNLFASNRVLGEVITSVYLVAMINYGEIIARLYSTLNSSSDCRSRLKSQLDQITFVEINHETISVVILSITLIQEGHLSVIGAGSKKDTNFQVAQLAQESPHILNGASIFSGRCPAFTMKPVLNSSTNRKGIHIVFVFSRAINAQVHVVYIRV